MAMKKWLVDGGGERGAKPHLGAKDEQRVRLEDELADSSADLDFSDTDEVAYQRLLLERFRSRHGAGGHEAHFVVGKAGGGNERICVDTAKKGLKFFPESKTLPSQDDLRKMSSLERLRALGGSLGPAERLAEGVRKGSTGGVRGENGKPNLADLSALKRKLEELRYKPPKGLTTVPWIETLVITAHRSTSETLRVGYSDHLSGEHSTRENGNQDISRESLFQEVAGGAVQEAYQRLRALGVEASRPPDFMAEMMKSDKQMLRIRSSLAEGQQRVKAAELRIRKKLDQKFRKKAGIPHIKDMERRKAKNTFVKAVSEWQKERRHAPMAREGSASVGHGEGRSRGKGTSTDNGRDGASMFGRSAEDAFDRMLSSTDGLGGAMGVRRNGHLRTKVGRKGELRRQDMESQVAGSGGWRGASKAGHVGGREGRRLQDGKKRELPLLPKKLRGNKAGKAAVSKGRGGTRRHKRGRR